MTFVEELKAAPIAILGAGAVGKAVGADSVLAGNKVHLYELPEFAPITLKNIEKTGITLGGKQNSLYGFERSGQAFFDLVTTDIAEAVKGAKIIIVGVPSLAHDSFFERLIPVLEDGMIVHIIPDNFGSLKLRKKMRELNCDKNVIVGGWTSAPYGARIIKEGGVLTSKMELKYRAISLRGASLPSTDQEVFLESSKAIGSFDAITEGDGVSGGKTVLDIGFSNVNPVLHCPGTILGASVMENFGRIFGGNDRYQYSIYSHAYSESVAEVQYAFYLEQVQLAEAIGVDLLRYPKKNFLSRTSILGPEYMGDDCIVPFDEQFPMAYGTGPFSIQDRYVTEDVPVGCHLYHELGKKYGVPTPVIDSMITLGSVMTGRDFYQSGLTLEDLDLAHLDKEQTLDYLENGQFIEKKGL
ncbi:NAD/NADP-dependent octopine/nopaline dehydrogenase family protein [Streptococcus sp. DD13]|uniref:NAD/NADP-dependent octopine/nopaline dehydrogenase family protein n=1 Tax=Streptococcus sp. DD13 TaxID=1777881 RepID=UPI00079AD437|nr:NAD/NADP-dependent octopine/nopaline dehydrogenase family protein [Streptococcus sp. DD13]KXT78907.1 D-octopine dehydrogenase [Streptococcus sp. DD13]